MEPPNTACPSEIHLKLPGLGATLCHDPHSPAQAKTLEPVLVFFRAKVLVRGTLHWGECAEWLSFYLSNLFIVLFLSNQVRASEIDRGKSEGQVCQVRYAQGGAFFFPGIIPMRNCKSAFGQNSKLQPSLSRNVIGRYRRVLAIRRPGARCKLLY